MDVAALFRTHQESLHRYLWRFCGDRTLADDAVQEAFLRLQTRPPGHGTNVRAWLFTVATNVVRDALRSGQRRRSLLAEGAGRMPLADEAPDPAAVAVAAERRRRVAAALAGLRERERTALLMREEGFSHGEIAEAIGSTQKSIGTLIARSLTKLARELDLDGMDR